MSDVIAKFKNVDFGFDKKIIQNFNGNILPGKLIALVGNNGSGKSCLIKTLCRFINPLNGSIELLGQNLSAIELSDFAKIVSVVLTEKIQSESMLVKEIVELGRSPFTNWLDLKTPTDIEIINKSITLLKLENLKDEYFSKLSDGQKQKVLIAKAIAQSPRLLILDEPTTYLDIPSKIDLIKNLRIIADENDIAILLSTHDIFLMRKIIDEVWIVSENKEIIITDPFHMIEMGQYKDFFGLDLN